MELLQRGGSTPTAPTAHRPQILLGLALLAAGCADEVTQPNTKPSQATALASGWQVKTPQPVFPTQGAAAVGVVVNGSGQEIIVSAGGWGPDRSRRADAYNPATDSWSRLPDMPIAMFHAGVTTVNNRLYLIGGGDPGFAEAGNRLYLYKPSVNQWYRRANLPLSKAEQTVGFTANGLVYALCTFCSEIDGRTNRHRLLRYDPATNIWKQRKASPHVNFSGASIDGKFYAVGTDTWLDIYDPATNAWTSKAAPFDLGTGPVGAVGKKLYVFNAKPSGYVAKYDPVTNQWTTAPPHSSERFEAAVRATLSGVPRLWGLGTVIDRSTSPHTSSAVNEMFTP